MSVSAPTSASSATRSDPPRGGNFLAALDVLRSPGNIVLAVVAITLAMGVAGIAAAALANGAGMFVALLLVTVAWLLAQAGYCSITVRHLHSARGEPVPGMVGAVAGGVLAAVKVLLATLLLVLALLVVMAAAALLFLLTQVPGIGPALNYVVFPVVALILGVALYALLFIAVPLAAVAASDGRSVFGCGATVVLAIRARLFDTAIRGVLASLIAGAVVVLALFIVSLGVGASGLLQGMVHVGGSSSHAYGGYGAYAGMAGGSLGGLMMSVRSVGAAAAVLYFLAFSLGLVAYAGGWVAIFDDGIGAIDPSTLESRMRTQAERVQQKAREAQVRAAQMARQHVDAAAARKAAAPPARPAATPPAQPPEADNDR
jgi:hypothetical protein